tara:strand:- start:370 stop:1263 length:894 start_codon:yes stop_codon:yes gene_type:complete
MTSDTAVPTIPIDFEEYDPARIEVWDNYIPIRNEVEGLTRAIRNATFPYLIESEKGQGKTLLVHTICKENGIALIDEPVGSGTRKSDLLGSKEINRDGTAFNLGIIPKAIEVANHFGHACLYCDEGNAQDHETQKWWNRICDGRKSITANGKKYKLNADCKLAIVWTINPVTYAGVNSLTEDLRSRFVGSVWDYPSEVDLAKVIDWTDISFDLVKKPLLQLVQDIHALRMKGDLEYALSIRDVAQFCEHLRQISKETPLTAKPIETVISEAIIVKFSDPTERELVKIRANDTFGVRL